MADEISRLRERVTAAEQTVTGLRQALWDVYAILGFDTDGDPTPAAVRGDLGELVRDAAREARADYDFLLNVPPGEPEGQ